MCWDYLLPCLITYVDEMLCSDPKILINHLMSFFLFADSVNCFKSVNIPSMLHFIEKYLIVHVNSLTFTVIVNMLSWSIWSSLWVVVHWVWVLKNLKVKNSILHSFVIFISSNSVTSKQKQHSPTLPSKNLTMKLFKLVPQQPHFRSSQP